MNWEKKNTQSLDVAMGNGADTFDPEVVRTVQRILIAEEAKEPVPESPNTVSIPAGADGVAAANQIVNKPTPHPPYLRSLKK